MKNSRVCNNVSMFVKCVVFIFSFFVAGIFASGVELEACTTTKDTANAVAKVGVYYVKNFGDALSCASYDGIEIKLYIGLSNIIPPGPIVYE